MDKTVEALVIGSGPAGMAAALSLKENGINEILIVEREDAPGGILLQCIHNGFGLHSFNEELTGPEYAERYINFVKDKKIEILTGTCALDIVDDGDGKKVILLSEEKGLLEISAKVVILAMGCRERNRGNIAIPGTRPAGIMTAGLAQKMVNKSGYIPGREIVILGSGDIGLIMARRLTLEGARVKAVVEIQSYPGGLNRNIVQCLNDFHIPLYLSHTITKISGDRRISSVEIAPLDESREPQNEKSFTLACDTLLLSVGLIPENELSLKGGVVLDKVTGGPVVDSNLMTSVPGIFACGNVLQVHDLVDWVSEESAYCGKAAASYVRNGLQGGREIPVKPGNMVRYTLPAKVIAGTEAVISLRPMAPAQNMSIIAKAGDKILYKKKEKKIFPSIMLRLPVKDIPEDAGCIEVFFSAEDKK